MESDEYVTKVLETLRVAVAEALERKRKLGHYAVIWRDGRIECVGPDAPNASQVESNRESQT